MFDFLIVFCAEYLILVSAIVLGLFWLFASREVKKHLALTALLALPLAYGLSRLLGAFYSHPQPFIGWEGEPLIPHEIDNAFPSDHVAVATVFATAVSLYNRRVAGVLGMFALAVGAARVVAGLHSVEDVGVALLVGLFSVWFAQLFAKRVFILVRRGES